MAIKTVTQTKKYVVRNTNKEASNVFIGGSSGGASVDLSGYYTKSQIDLLYGPIVSVKAYGATGDGITDDTTAIQAAFDASTNVYFPSGTYIIGNVIITNDGTYVHGDGITSILRFKDGETGAMLAAGTNNIIVSKIRLTGGVFDNFANVETMVADRSGLSLMSNKNTIISEITIDGFENTGLLVTNTEQTLLFDRFSVLNSKINSCWIGIETGLDAENYTKYSGLELYYCRYAVMLGCGNINFANSNLYKNYYAFYVDGTRPNDAHGNINSCLINHNDHSLYITDVYGGYTIVGNNIYEGNISIIDSSGVRISNNQITVNEFYLHGPGRNWILDNNIRTTYDNIITHDGGEDETIFINNRFTDGSFLENRTIGDVLSAGNGIDATNKKVYLINGQYNSDAEPEGYMAVLAYSTNLLNLVTIGGGSTSYNAANLIRFNTASDLATRFGTERMRIDGNGNVMIGFDEGLAKFSINGGVHIGGESDPGDDNLLVDGTSTFKGIVYADNLLNDSGEFISGFAGSGWKLEMEDGESSDDQGVYTMELDNLTIRRSLTVYELIVNKIRANNGAFMVSAGVITLIGAVEDGAYYNMQFDDDDGNITCPFIVNDIVRVQSWNGRGIKYYTAEVVEVHDLYFRVQIIDGTGIPDKGDVVVQAGYSSSDHDERQGFIYMTSSDTDAPYIDILSDVVDEDWSGHTRVRLGNLDGIGSLSGFGLYVNNGEIANFTINAEELHFYDGVDQHLYLNNDVKASGYYGRGLTLYDAGADHATKEIMAVSLGQIRPINTIEFGATEEYGFEVIQKTDTDTYKHLIRMAGETNIIAGWNIDYDAIYTGFKSIEDGYNEDSEGGITLAADGGLHAPNFYINADGSIGVRNITIETPQVDTGGGVFMSVKIDDNGIYEPTIDEDYGYIDINAVGYQGGITKYRDLRIFDGKGDLMARFDGSSDSLTLDCSLVTNNAVVIGSGVNLIPRVITTDGGAASDILTTDSYIVWNYTAGDGTITLPSTPRDGQLIIVSNITTTRTLTIDGGDNNMIVNGSLVSTSTLPLRRTAQFIFSTEDDHWFLVGAAG